MTSAWSRPQAVISDRPLTGRLRSRSTFANGDTCDMPWHHGDWIEDEESIASPPARQATAGSIAEAALERPRPMRVGRSR